MENMGIKELKNFYNGKTVLVTGHTGFKGSWLSIWLTELGAKVIGYSLEPTNSRDNYNVSGLSKRIINTIADIRDKKTLEEVIKKYNPEIVFHLAAQPLVKLSYLDPIMTYETNVMGTLNVLESIKNSESIKAGIMVTTDKCYENKEQIWAYREDDRMGGYDPYSSSKGCCEILISSYRNSFLNLKDIDKHEKAIASVRAGNVIGGGDWACDRIIPDCVRALEDKREIKIRNPKAIRPWQYVLEPLYGYLKLAMNLYTNPKKYSEGWNFGPNTEGIIKVSEIVKLLIKYWGSGTWVDISDCNKVHEANLLSLDCTKSRIFLGWKTILGIEDTIEFTAKWYKHFSDDMYDFNVKQINEYCDLIRKNEVKI